MNKFDMTNEGYNKAKEYLEKIGKLKEFENNNTSVDGFSLIYFANFYYANTIRKI